MGDERILGGSEFVESVLKRSEENYEERTYAILKGLQINDVVECVDEILGMEAEALKGAGKNRKVTRARALVCFIAVNRLRFKGADVARILRISPSTVSKAANRGRSDIMSEEIWDSLYR